MANTVHWYYSCWKLSFFFGIKSEKQSVKLKRWLWTTRLCLHPDASGLIVPVQYLAKDVRFDPNCVACVAGAQSCEKHTRAAPLNLESWPEFKGCCLCTANTVTYWNLPKWLTLGFLVGAKMQRGCVELRSASFSTSASRPLCKVVCLQTTTARSHRLHNAGRADGRSRVGYLQNLAVWV